MDGEKGFVHPADATREGNVGGASGRGTVKGDDMDAVGTSEAVNVSPEESVPAQTVIAAKGPGSARLKEMKTERTGG